MSENPGGRKRARLLSRALKAIRAIRPAKTRDLAPALGLSLRGYQHFEAGGGQLNIDHVLNFAAALDSDPFGILVGVQIGHPEFAAYVARNKAMMALMIGLQEFVEDTGDAIALLDTATFVSAYRTMFKDLSAQALTLRDQNAGWLAQNAERLGMVKPPKDEDESS